MNKADVIAAIDVGAETINIVLLSEGKLVYSDTANIGLTHVSEVADRLLREAVEKVGINIDDLRLIVGTGSHSEEVSAVQETISDSIAVARGINSIAPSTHTLIDVGASKFTTLKCRDGSPTKIAKNDRCAAGAGVALRMAASVLQLGIEEIGPLSLKAKEDVEINATCSVFAESEIISLIHHGRNKPEDVLKGLYRGMAARFYSLVMTIGVEDDVYMVGGVAKNEGMVQVMAERLNHPVLVPPDPCIIGALGAALIYSNGRGGE